ncbi:MAG: hypothetical protein H7Y43_04670, partial [Akkermansiaceae bacterium]|nr:hypothetical protein [Verrucomicrobiales bacterium]
MATEGRAATRTWNGGGANLLWSNAGNWGGFGVVEGDHLSFAGATKLINTNDILFLRINSLSYDGSGFLNVPRTNGPGYTVMITNGIVDTFGGNTNNIPLILGGSQSFSNQSPSTTLVLGGTINMSNSSLTIGGPGEVFLTGVISGNGAVGVNSVTINDGLVRLGAANTFNGGVTVNSGMVQLGNAGGIPSGNARGDLFLASGASLDLGNSSPTLNGLIGAGVIDENQTTNAGNYTITLGTANSNGV